MELYANIKKLRQVRGYSKKYMADKLMITDSQYSKVEAGTTKMFVERLYEIAEILEVSVVKLLGLQNNSYNIKQDELIAELNEKVLFYKEKAHFYEKVKTKKTAAEKN